MQRCADETLNDGYRTDALRIYTRALRRHVPLYGGSTYRYDEQRRSQMQREVLPPGPLRDTAPR